MPIFDTKQLKSQNGVVRTKSLFIETSYDDPRFWIMTLKEHDQKVKGGKTLLSLPRLYVEYCTDDPSEYTLAQEVFGSWKVWSALANADKRIQHAIGLARVEADVKRKSLAFREVIKDIKSGDASFQTKKWIVDEPWKAPEKATDGRKIRKKQTEVAQAAFEKEGLSEDLQRLKDEGYLQ